MAQNLNVRVQKMLSEQGVMSRRKAEEAISRGRVTVNGHPCTLGQKINPKRLLIRRLTQFVRNW